MIGQFPYLILYTRAARLSRRRGWALVPIWTSESWTSERLRVETLRTIYRAAWALAHGDARTLGEMLAQEGMAARFAAFFGDEAARSVGFPPIGLSERAGFAAARAAADESPLTPEEMLASSALSSGRK